MSGARIAKRHRSSAWVWKSADKNLDGLVAGVGFDADRCIAEIDFVSATIISPDDRVRHLRLPVT